MNLFESNIFTLIYTCLVIGLIVLFSYHLLCLLEEYYKAALQKKHHVINMNQKLDRIIELLEKIKIAIEEV